MAELLLFNKPYGVLSQFQDHDGHPGLKHYIRQPGVYPMGRLDRDSEGLLLLSGDGRLQARITDPKNKMPKTYLVQVEGEITPEAVTKLADGVMLNDGMTRPAKIKKIPPPDLWSPPIRVRKNHPTSWIELQITEGRNRQVRRMTAAVVFPTLRLVRSAIGPWMLGDIKPGDYARDNVHLPQQKASGKTKTNGARPSRSQGLSKKPQGRPQKRS
jgi:23S rRNA pseudouridine2457 synthase